MFINVSLNDEIFILSIVGRSRGEHLLRLRPILAMLQKQNCSLPFAFAFAFEKTPSPAIAKLTLCKSSVLQIATRRTWQDLLNNHRRV
jgi:hypothetical protein